MQTDQMNIWRGEFGRDYMARNTFETVEAFNAVYVKRLGRTRDDLNREWLADVPRDAKVLEVGANIGNQLAALQRIGFKRLYGVELQRRCVEEAKLCNPGVDIVEGSAYDIPFKEGFFDLVFTNNVLIHFAPDDLGGVIDEIDRVGCRFIWGFEPYSKDFTKVDYRGHDSLMWRADYCALFLERFSHYAKRRAEEFPFLNEPGCVDKQYLIERGPSSGA